MAVTVLIGELRATIRAGIWHCDDPRWEQLLNAVTRAHPPHHYEPSPDRYYAELVVERLGLEKAPE